MSAVEETLRLFRAQFLAGARKRLDDIGRLLDQLADDPADRVVLEQIAHHFHSLAGSGGTYGFPIVSELAGREEVSCRVAIAQDRPLSEPERIRCREVLDPLTTALAAGAQTTERPPAAAASGPPDILVVDDDREVVSMLARLAEREGMSVRRAGTIAQALSQIERRMPEGLLADIGLSDGSGYELVERLRALPGGDAVAVLIVSGLGGFLDKVEAIHCGADGFFQKPLDGEALFRRLHHLLERQRTEPGRVLSVEDDPVQAAFLRTVLESAGYEVRICADPKHFESDLATFRPDLVLMDIDLPGTSGYELARYLRQEERYATLPVIFLTTQGLLQTRIESVRAGGDEHLVKPVVPGLLLTAVAARVERARFVKNLLQRDGLTRLLTHTAFLESSRALLSQKRRSEESDAALVMIDLDRFKSVNDTYGHPVGDRVLVSLASLLRRRLRQSDTIGRLGGEEFAVLLQDLGREDALRLLERLRDEFASIAHTTSSGAPFSVTFSAGIALLDPRRMDLKAWVEAADRALYEAKGAGRNCVRVAT